MHGKHLFEYAVIRVVPRVEREEFINAGVILYCPKQRFLDACIHPDYERLTALFPSIETDVVEAHLASFSRICAGGKGSGPIGLLDAASRFRWLTAMRSTMVQTSRVHPGFCADAAEALRMLYEQLVG